MKGKVLAFVLFGNLHVLFTYFIGLIWEFYIISVMRDHAYI